MKNIQASIFLGGLSSQNGPKEAIVLLSKRLIFMSGGLINGPCWPGTENNWRYVRTTIYS